MIYELTIDNGREKPVIAFLKQLDFVVVKPSRNKKNAIDKVVLSSKNKKEITYFGTCPGWDLNVKKLRNQSTEKRLNEWL